MPTREAVLAGEVLGRHRASDQWPSSNCDRPLPTATSQIPAQAQALLFAGGVGAGNWLRSSREKPLQQAREEGHQKVSSLSVARPA